MAKSLFRSPTAAAAVTPTTTLLARGHPPVVPAPAGAGCCPRRLGRRRRPQPPAACGAGGCAVDYGADDLPPARGTPAYRWLRSSRWHVVEAAGAYATDGGEDAPRLKIDARRRVRRSRRRSRALHRRAAASWSSGDSGWFSSDDDVPYAPYSRSGTGGTPLVASTATTESSSTTGASASGTSAAAGAGAREEVALGDSFAVVKRSADPRADFRRSMAEMVVGRGIYDADGLERLLRCFLALNDRRHRRDIVAAFGDVWEAVFANPPSLSRVSTSCKAAPVRP